MSETALCRGCENDILHLVSNPLIGKSEWAHSTKTHWVEHPHKAWPR